MLILLNYSTANERLLTGTTLLFCSGCFHSSVTDEITLLEQHLQKHCLLTRIAIADTDCRTMLTKPGKKLTGTACEKKKSTATCSTVLTGRHTLQMMRCVRSCTVHVFVSPTSTQRFRMVLMPEIYKKFTTVLNLGLTSCSLVSSLSLYAARNPLTSVGLA